MNTYTNYLSPGPTGVNQTYHYWNMLTPSTGNQIIKYLSPSVTSTSAMIPSATLLMTDGGSDTLFLTDNAQGLVEVGSKTALGVLNYNDPSLELKLSLTYGDSWSDATGDTYTVSGFAGTRTGTITGVADAYGTIQLPGNPTPFMDVLRVKVRRQITDASLPLTIDRIGNIHYYFIPTMKYPIVKLVEDSVRINGGAWSIARTAQSIGNPALVGVNELSPDQFTFTAYPNPATNELNIAFAEGRNATTRLEVLDAAGRVVLTRTMTGDRAAMDTQSLPAGHYSVRAFAGDRLIGVRPLIVD